MTTRQPAEPGNSGTTCAALELVVPADEHRLAPIVLLDEATAAIDPENELAVHDALARLTAREGPPCW